MKTFVMKWGYLAVFLGSLIEGESVILSAGYFASQGYLSLYKIILISFVGTVIADQLLFIFGRIWGQHFIRQFSFVQKAAQKAFHFLENYKNWFLLSFRFIYGIRIISPVVIGASPISFRYFFYLNIIAAAIWAIISCSVGYLFGEFLMKYLTSLQRFLVLGSVGFLLLSLFIWKAYKLFRRI
jgi:membrane protein DedA with SNARE-associated domain